MQPSIPSFDHARVLVVGDVMLDRYWYGDTSRISPEAPVPVVHVKHLEKRPGGAANVAVNVAAVGAKPTLVGVVGNDDAGASLAELLREGRVEFDFTPVSGFATVTKMRVLSRNQQLIRLDVEQDANSLASLDLRPSFNKHLPDCQCVVLSDYRKGALAMSPELIAAARAANKPVLVDPKGADFAIYAGATLLTPNLAEFENVVGACPDERALVERATRLLEELKLEALLVTRGEQGMSLLRADAPPEHLGARAREVYDVTGAGDTVIGVLAAAIAAGLDFSQATSLANTAAGIVVGKLGAATANVDELQSTSGDTLLSQRGWLAEDALAFAIRHARAQGERIVMTNGCFDIVHAGHVAYLRKAKALGDRLVVALNNDASVSRLKGNGRPINNLADRVSVVAALDMVDWVTDFAQDTPEDLIKSLSPDVLVKGGDYSAQDVAGGDWVTASGGRVEIIDFLEGRSTTAIIAAAAALQKGNVSNP